MELWQLDATELARLIRVGQASSREAVGACLARMDAVNGRLNAVVRRMDEEALAAANAADAARAHGDALGPLHGVPVTIKVNTDQKDHPTDNVVVAFRDLIAPDDAPVVANLRTAGASHQCARILNAEFFGKRSSWPYPESERPRGYLGWVERRRRGRGGNRHRPNRAGQRYCRFG